MYQALYRKWRPRSFDDVVGQAHITETLKRQVASGHTAHAYLFTGTRGTGKTTCAKILARAVNCEHPVDGNPCNECPACLGIESGAILDVTEMDAASNNGVESVRALREEAVYTPAAVKRRVYIIDEVHMLSNSAFNALLKIMEEPPEHLMFILATTELHKVPATILSRCQRYAFKRLLPEDIVARLQYVAGREGIPLTEDAANLLARLSDGAMRDALSLMDQCRGEAIDRARVLSVVGLAENSELMTIYDSLTRGDALRAISTFESLYAGGKEVSTVLEMLASLYRDLCMAKLDPALGGNLLSGLFTDEELRGMAVCAELPDLLGALELIHQAQAELDTAPDRRACAELCLLTLCGCAARRPAVPAAGQASGIAAVQPPVVQTQSAAKPAPAEAENPAQPVQTRQSAPGDADEKPRPAPQAQAEERKPEQKFSQIDLLRALKGKISDSDYALLGENTNVELRLEGNRIDILVKVPIFVSILDSDEVKNTVARTASELYGGSFSARVAPLGDDVSQKANKLDELAKLGGIRFE